MRLALAQINSVVGDIDGNAASVAEWLGRAREANADLVLFPELVVTGYPPEDLLLRPGFVRAARRAVDEIARSVHGITVLVGAPHLETDLYNACFVLAHGEVRGVYKKWYLPELRRLRRGSLLRRRARPSPASPRRRRGRPDDLRGRLAARAARDRSRARRCAAGDQHLRVAVPRRQGPGARGDAQGPGHRQLLLLRAVQRGRRPGRADLRRPLGGARRRGRGARPRRRVRGRAAGGRHRPGRRGGTQAARRTPPRARARPGTARRDRVGARSGAQPGHGSPGPGRRAARRPRADAARARARPARLRDEERLRRRRDRTVRRDRLGADCCALRRGPRARARPWRLDAVALLLGRHARRRRAPGGVARDRLPRDRDRADGRSLHRRAGRDVRGT